MPFAINPGFHPGMVVVGMCPTGRINLSGRYTDRAKCSYQEGRFFTTTSPCRTHGRQGCTGTFVRGCIVNLLMTPMVYLQYCIMQVETFYPWQQLTLEHDTRTVKILVIHSDRKNKMAEQVIRHLPSHFLPHLQRSTHIGQEEVATIVSKVVGWHISIKKLHGFPFIGIHFFIEHFEDTSFGQYLLLGLKVFLQLCLIITCLLTHDNRWQQSKEE